jgi:hypothetical protein
MKLSRQKEWAEAARRCRLSPAAVAMAKELGLSPRSLTKNIPTPSQRWKAPVEDWVRGLHEKRFGRRPPPTPAETAPQSDDCAPEPPDDADNEFEVAQDAVLKRLKEGGEAPEVLFEEMEELERSVPVSGGEIADQNRLMLLRRDCFRRFAGLFAPLAARLDFVERVVLFGSVAAPLQKEVPRFSRMRRAHVAVWHECKDLDLAVWVGDLARLRELKRALIDATNRWQAIANAETLPGIAAHQVDVFIMEPGNDRYRGNLCHFGQCPKGKPECAVTGCGAQPFLRLYRDFDFDPRAPFGPHAVVLFARPLPDAPF